MSKEENPNDLFRTYLKQQQELFGGEFWSSRVRVEKPREKAASAPDTVRESSRNRDYRAAAVRRPSAASPPRREQPLFYGGDNVELRAFYHEIKNCMECGLGKTRTNFVFGAGNPNADIMFVGEAPGRDEDLRGEPFVGRAGKMLDKLLAEINLDRSKYFIGNILKCRPPQNRDPNPMEAATCIPYLERQIELIRPKVIVALGRISAQMMLQTSTPIGKLRGTTHQYRGIDFIVVYHPAALLRNQNLVEPTRNDLRKISRTYLENSGDSGGE